MVPNRRCDGALLSWAVTFGVPSMTSRASRQSVVVLHYQRRNRFAARTQLPTICDVAKDKRTGTTTATVREWRDEEGWAGECSTVPIHLPDAGRIAATSTPPATEP